MFFEFKFLFYFFLGSFVLSFILFFLSYILVRTDWDYEKISIYECGFIPFKDSRGQFPVQFLLYAIVFLVFDLELSFFFPWTLIAIELDFWGIFVVIFFIFLLLGGFFYEWLHGIFELD